jgi:hypothetical protein
VDDSEPKILTTLERLLKESRLLRAKAEKQELPVWPASDTPAAEDETATATPLLPSLS